MYGGPTVATPSCQPLAPRIPGYRRICPYTSHPRPDVALGWARSGSRTCAGGGFRQGGARVDVWGTTERDRDPNRASRIHGSVLRSIGLRARLHVVPYQDISPGGAAAVPAVGRRRLGGGVPGRLGVSPGVLRLQRRHEQWLCLRSGPGSRDAHRGDGAALRPRRAAARWTAVDHRLVDQADWVPTRRINAIELVSKRLAGYQLQPRHGLPGRPGLAAVDTSILLVCPPRPG